jgi:hypothetical protein
MSGVVHIFFSQSFVLKTLYSSGLHEIYSYCLTYIGDGKRKSDIVKVIDLLFISLNTSNFKIDFYIYKLFLPILLIFKNICLLLFLLRLVC